MSLRAFSSPGALLMLLELTAVRLGLTFRWSLDGMFLQVIWAIGLSMALLGFLIRCGITPRAIGVLGGLIVLSHNLLDFGVSPPERGSMMRAAPRNPLFTLLLRPGPIPLCRVSHGSRRIPSYPGLA